MLVFVSDLHLTDGTSGETIEPGAFAKFGAYLENMAVAAGATDLEVVFLGDLFDCIRSEYWLASAVRPWSGDTGVGEGLHQYTKEILRRIVNNAKNRESLGHLKSFKTKMESRNVKVKYTYIIGNHDWLVNRYPDTRVMAAEALGIEDPARFLTSRFPVECFWEEYRAVARHGDVYDPFNYCGDRDASSLGDAIVIDLVNKFPSAVGEAIEADFEPALLAMLKELDNVRPLIDVPLWIQSVCRQIGTKDTEETVKRVWNRTVDQFLSIDFVQRYDKPWQFDLVDQLELCLKITKTLSIEELLRLPLRLALHGRDQYAENAWKERLLVENRAAFSVYGHTHVYKMCPLDKVITPDTGAVLDKMYFNTGTWRKMHSKAAHADRFAGWHVMTFIALYLPNERGGMKFEVWNGALG